jgi:hypothetical protein
MVTRSLPLPVLIPLSEPLPSTFVQSPLALKARNVFRAFGAENLSFKQSLNSTPLLMPHLKNTGLVREP